MTDIRLLYVTTKDSDQARSIARELLERRLIACANIFPMMQSIYRWNDVIQSESESVLILKTSLERVKAATDAIMELHSYETPCVLTLPVESGSEGYLRWLANETS